MIYIGAIIIIVVQNPQTEVNSEATAEAVRVEGDGLQGSPNGFFAQCKNCGWGKPYETAAKAKQALGAHSRFCRGPGWRISPFARRL